MLKRINVLDKIPQSAFIFLFFFSLYMMVSSGRFTTSMDIEVYRTAKNVVENGHFGLEKKALSSFVGQDGKYYVVEGLALILTAVLFYVFLKGIGVSPDMMVILMNPLLTSLVCVLIYLIGKELKYSNKTALVLAFVYGLGTMALVHSKFMLPEPLISVLFLLAFLFLLKYKASRKTLWLFLCGLFSGLTILIRPDGSIFIGIITCAVGVLLFQDFKRRTTHLTEVLKTIFIFTAPLLICFCIFCYYNYFRFGNILETGYTLKTVGGEGTYSYTKRLMKLLNIQKTFGGFLGMWIIPCRSIFFINPVLICVFLSLKEFWRKYKYESIIFAALLVLYSFLFMNRGPIGFPGSAAWGVRYMLPIIGFMVLPIGVFVERFQSGEGKKWSRLFTLLLVISACFQLIGSAVSYQKVQMPLEYVFGGQAARPKITMNPGWNLIYQNIKILTTGRVDVPVEEINRSRLLEVLGHMGVNVEDQDLSLQDLAYLLARKGALVNQQKRTFSFFLGRGTDLMYYNHLRKKSPPLWAILSLTVLALTFLGSGFCLLRPFIQRPKKPKREEQVTSKKRRKRGKR